MSRVFCDFAVSADGFADGPGQTRDQPFGLHDWMFEAAEENRAEVDAITDAGSSKSTAGSSSSTGSAHSASRSSPPAYPTTSTARRLQRGGS